jgi:hypothetical protein
MEGNMVDDYFDNSDIRILPKEAIRLIKEYFNNNMPKYLLKNEYLHSPYWSIAFSNNEINILIEGDVGFNAKISIEKTDFPLWQFDRRVANTTKTNSKNILFVLDVIKVFSEN